MRKWTFGQTEGVKLSPAIFQAGVTDREKGGHRGPSTRLSPADTCSCPGPLRPPLLSNLTSLRSGKRFSEITEGGRAGSSKVRQCRRNPFLSPARSKSPGDQDAAFVSNLDRELLDTTVHVYVTSRFQANRTLGPRCSPSW